MKKTQKDVTIFLTFLVVVLSISTGIFALIEMADSVNQSEELKEKNSDLVWENLRLESEISTLKSDMGAVQEINRNLSQANRVLKGENNFLQSQNDMFTVREKERQGLDDER